MLILKQNSANSVPTPPAGKGTIFLDDSDTLSVKTSDGNVETFPTVAAANTQVVFIDGTSLSGNANLTYNKNTDTLALSGSLAAGNVKTNNLLYANGSPWDLEQPGGSNTQIQFNDDESFGGSAALTFDKSSNLVTVAANLNANNLNATTHITSGNVWANSGTVGTATLSVSGNANVANLNTSGNAVIGGNLTVNGNVTYVNVDTLQVEDPVISLGGGPNGAPLTSNDGKDRGTLLNYYTTNAIDAFMGWDNSNGEFSFGSNVTIVNDVVTFNALGNVRASTVLANVSGGTGTFSGNVQAANFTISGGAFYGNAAGLTNIPGANITGNINGNISNANYAAFAGQVVDSTQSNITSVGKLTSLLAGANSDAANFANATVIAAAGDSGATDSARIGLVGESVSNGVEGIGLYGIGKVNGANKATGVQGYASVTNTNDTGAAVGVRGYANATHAGGYNIGVLGNASGSGLGNYAFYVQAGNIASIETNTAWDLYDDSVSALAFNSAGKANILAISTDDGNEGVSMSGTLAVTGNITATAGIKTDNYYYANGSPVDFQQAGGTNTQVQFNDGDNFGGSAAFTFDKTSNVVTMSGNLSVANVAATGALVGATVTSNGTANVGNLSTAGTVTATGNVSGGNLTTAGVVAATGNVSGGNITTAGVVSATGNVSGGNVSSAGVLSVTGNANVGNLGTGGLIIATGNVTGGNVNTAGKVVASTFESNVADGTAPLVVLSTTKVANLNADLLDGYSTATAATANTVIVRDADGSFSANVVTANLSGNATTAGTVTTAAQPNITSVGTLSALSVTGNVSTGNISGTLLTGTLTTNAQPNVTSVGTLTGLSVDGSNITLANGVFTGNGSGLSALAGGNVTGQVANALVAGTVYTAAQPNITSVGTLSSLAVTGNASAGNISTGGVLSVTGNANVGNIGATNGVFTNVSGNGSALSSITGANVTGQVANALVAGTVYTNAQPNITSVGTLTSVAVTGNATAGNVYANTGTIGASLLTGTLTTAAQPNVTSVGTLSSLSVTGNVAAGNLTTVGILSVTGTGTSIIAGNLDMTSNNIINLAEPVNASDAATKAYVDSVAEGLHTHDSCNAATTGTLATISGGTVTYNNGTAGVGATLTTTGSYTTIDGVTLADNMRILVKNEANAAHNGIYVRSSSTVLTRATDFDTPAEMAGGDFTFVTAGTLYDNTGWVMTDPVTTVGTTDVNWVQFSGAGTFTAGSGLTLTGTQFSVNVAQPGITSLGTLTGLAVNGNITAANITANTGVFTGNGSGLSAIAGANVTGQVGNALVAGTVYTAAQPNITSVGTLTSLGVNGTVTAVAFTANTGVFTGNGSGLSAIAGANVTGTVSSATTAGTVTTAAQPNITSVGTLTGLTLAANADITMSGTGSNINGVALVSATLFEGSGANLTNINASNVSSGTLAQARLANATLTLGNTTLTLGATTTTVAGLTSVTSTTFVGALTGAATTAGTVTTAAQPNITSTGTLTGLGVNGNITAANITANTGVFTGNGSGLSALNASNISSGTLAQARLANASVTLGSTALTLGSTVTTVAGLTSVTSTSFVGALTGAATTAGTVTTAAQPNITSVGTLTGLTVSSTISGSVSGTAATVTTAAQPNITSVGTLTSLGSSGNITAPNFIANTGFFMSSVNAAVSAAGTVQGNATALTRQVNVTSTVASGAGVVLPTAVAGMRITLINTAANACLVYPASGGQINALGTNASYSLPAGGRLDYQAVSATQWYTLNATYG